MTVSSTTTKAQYSGNGTTTVFAVPFYFLLNSDLLVILRSSAGVETTQVLTTNYTVTGAGNEAGGSITMLVAPPTGTTLTILRNAPATQETDLIPNDRLPAESLEDALDKLTMLVQQLDEESARSLKFAATDSSTATTLPTSPNRAGKFLSFDNSGNPIVVGATDTYTINEEVKTATQGQTVFTLTTMTYTPGINNLAVFVDGVNQYRGTSYTETSPTVVTFSQGLHAGAVVKFSTVRTLTSDEDNSDAILFLQAGTGALSRSVQNKLRDTVSVKDFGAVGDGVTDDTAAIQAAVNAVEANRNNEIYFPVGNYVIAGTITIHGGIRLIGLGAMGAQVGQGVVLSHKANNVNMLVWDGNATNAAFGIGGGIFNIQCVKFSGYSGGDAIKLVAISDNYRPGEFTVENVLVWKGDGGVWSRGFHVDGTAANTPGSKGVRSIKIDKLRVGDCSENNQYIYLNQAVHVVSEYLQIDTGSGTGTCGMTIAGDSENIILNGLVLNGNLIIGGSSTMNVVLNGRVGTLDVNNTGVLGSANIQATAITNASIFFRIVSNVTDSFMASVASTISNVTGDNTTYPITFDTEIFDSAGSFSGDTFTAKCAGRYLFTWCVGYTGLTSSHTRQDTGPVQKRSSVTILSAAKVSNPYAQGANSGLNYSESGSIEMLLLEGDTVVLNANVSGGTKVVDILGAATAYTWFSGQYLP